MRHVTGRSRAEVAVAVLCTAAALAAPLLLPSGVARVTACIAPMGALLWMCLQRRMRWAVAGLSSMLAGNLLFGTTVSAQGLPAGATTGDAFFLVGYLALLGAAWRAVGAGARKVVLDALVVVAGPVAVMVSVVHEPLAAAGASQATALTLVYSAFDLALLVAVVTAALRGSLGRGRAWALHCACLLLLTGDGVYARLEAPSSDALPFWLFSPFNLAYALAALTMALSPRGPRGRRDGRERSRVVLVLLPASACLPAAALVLQGLAGNPVDWQVLGTGALLTAVLSTVRLHGALRAAALHAVALQRLALVDDLTGLPNRRSCTDDLDRALQRPGRAVAVALLDLDRFKAVNDTLGHAAGDALLRDAARAWRAALPTGAGLYRWGGEEFVVLLQDVLALRARALVDDVRLATPAPHTVSAGLALHRSGEAAAAVLARADTALYEAKQTGRNRVCDDSGQQTGTGAAAAPELDGAHVTAARG